MHCIPPSSVNPHEMPALPMGFPVDTLYNTVPPDAFLADISTIGSTGLLFTGASQAPLLGYGPYQQTCFSDWPLQTVPEATFPSILPSQNFIPELRPQFMEDILPLAAETYSGHLEEHPNHRWQPVSQSIHSQELQAVNPADSIAVITDRKYVTFVKTVRPDRFKP
ncbi:uncharacterized protein CDV56_104831 [Aspergillus thermomutatus]|uniref:Uncharacterized protein n=1 Tax=Aspergillus thermomutatus TaxID=41047 RepID=A0A397H434_ASPTH|nr:uncharacterized protein CDV56_104831 [Aspergillus thermomutatus]RHZ55160.1 hypothetical protein CDV56_104831 [Aspergillus thermomutatus]